MKQRPKKPLDHVREAIRLKHYLIRTEEFSVTWVKRYLFFHFFHNKRHPSEMGSAAMGAFLTHLAVQQKVAASTQHQAFSASFFL
jgi:Phage integrase, N-terminal SAM-like domain